MTTTVYLGAILEILANTIKKEKERIVERIKEKM